MEEDITLTEEVSQEDMNEIARLIQDGNTGGILDDEDGFRVSWDLTINKFKN